MRRIVIGLVVAGIVLMPAIGMAAQVKPTHTASWWQVVVEWVSKAIGINKSETLSTPPGTPTPSTPDPNNNLDAGSTIDPYG